MDNEANRYLIQFGDNLRKQRIAQVLSQKQLAFETGLTREFINRIENGKVNISLTNIMEIARVLNIAPKDLLNFK
ncbi:helix-turn-helix transcriptional regulator [Aequorivita sp. SDUM287046]|uniref:Helix-turn-helix transcriptional regulator n=1 Tax=Aequorivita aurantiaca TaxID=3053356 RepID=A0ABT8DCW6_9FLAO|nr:helix-turn-helix transcriptional regulator [Aequorivita aurantiaca]MDN3723000.1 helix-turn-helix transcriptional regulator [Aequorivita aurantiaca]